MVAKSFQKYEHGEPYLKNGRMYVKLSTGREVRWYNEAEYQRMYPEEEVEVKRLRSVKDVLGFEKGYITILKGNVEAVELWLRKEPVAQFNRWFGWHVPSEKEVPQLPAELSTVRLNWEDVSINDNKLKPENEVIKFVESLIYGDSTSQFMGNVGERIEFTAIVRKAIPITNYFGEQTFHVMETDEGNVLTWLTGSRTLEVGTQYHMRGTVKMHDIYKGTKQTNLTRCTEVK